MASANLSVVLPGALFVGEDDRARIVAHTGPAAGWHTPRGILGWSAEVSFVDRTALTDSVRSATKLVAPEEQIPTARLPLTAQAALASPLVAVSSRLVRQLIEHGVRVHTVGVDRVTSSFYYLAEGGSEEAVRVEGDLVQSVGVMLGERADNAAIERVLDGLPDRLLRALSKDRVSELSVELAALLPRAAADGSGTVDVDLEAFERDLESLVGGSEPHAGELVEMASGLAETSERRVDVPIFGEARRISQGPFELTLGDRRVALPTCERWVLGRANLEAAGEQSSVAPEAAKLADEESVASAPEAQALREAEALKKAEEEAAAAAAAEALREAEALKKAEEEAAAAVEALREAEALKKAEEEAAAAVEALREAEALKKAEEEAAAAAAEALREAEALKKAEEEAAAAAAEALREAEALKKAEEEAATAAAEALREAEALKKAEQEAAAAKRAVSVDREVSKKSSNAPSATGAKAKKSAAPETERAVVAPKKTSSAYVVVALLAAAIVWRLFLHK